MPAIGNRRSTTGSSTGYRKDAMYKSAQAFREVASSILNESGHDLFMSAPQALQFPAVRNALKSYFLEDAVDQAAAEAEALEPEEAAEAREDAEETLSEQFINDVEAINEHTNLASVNPVIGMTFPIHKNILMNNVFDKGAIPKFVAREPKFTISMETRILVTPEGEEIDMFKEQYKMYDAINSTAPFVDIDITLPSAEGAEDVLNKVGGSDGDMVSIDTYISAVQFKGVYLKDGDIDPETGVKAEAGRVGQEIDCWVPVNLKFTPNYGNIDRTIAEEATFTTRDSSSPDDKTKVLKGVIMGYMRDNKFALSCTTEDIKAVRLTARLDTSSAQVKTCSTRWKVNTDIVEIGSAHPINTTVSPEEVKDVGALYNVNQLTKILSLMKTALGEYKDTGIKRELDKSFRTMPATSKFATSFDFAPRQGYALDHVEWRYKTFMDYLDSVTTGLFQVLNDPNMTVSIFGSPELIRKITPTEYSYQTPSNIGPVELDFVKTVVTSDKRVYQFLATDKLRGNPNLIIVLCPRNTDRIVYRIYDYQMYVSNEIRNLDNPSLPAIHAFERWKFVEYQPVQGRIRILHPSGLEEIAPNTDPIGEMSMSDFNLLQND